ncbi:hypothetical protein ACIFOE_23410 [Paenibacillus sp. NRS-1783]|uniref:hypothetical protein n=1 Tax=Paenibacillus sp. NRS-1783 TaxID=3233907 RepID=UPI003D27469E
MSNQTAVTTLVKINVNDEVKVRLSDQGFEMLKAFYQDAPVRVQERIGKSIYGPDKDGFTTFKVCALVQVFGGRMDLGVEPPFADEMIYMGNSTSFIQSSEAVLIKEHSNVVDSASLKMNYLRDLIALSESRGSVSDDDSLEKRLTVVMDSIENDLGIVRKDGVQ